MDIAPPELARKKTIQHSLYGVSALSVIAVITVGISRLEPATPRVDRDTIDPDTVQRGPMVRQVRGAGTLVPEQIRSRSKSAGSRRPLTASLSGS
jgi:hypothetical protein